MSLSNTIKSLQDTMRKDVGVDGDAQRLGQLVWLLFLKIFDDRETEAELLQDHYKSPIPEPLRWRSWAADAEGLTGDDLLKFLNSELFPKLKALNVENNPRALVVREVFKDAYQYMKSGQLLRQVVNQLQAGINFNSAKDRHLFGELYEQLLCDLQNAGNAGEYYTPRAVTQFIVQMADPKLGEKILDPACGTGGFLTGAIEHIRRSQVKTPDDEARLQTSIFGVEKKPLPHLLCTTNMLVHGIDVPSQIRHDNTLSRPLRNYGPQDHVDVVITNPPFGGMEEDGIETNFPATFRTKETADLFLVLIINLLKDGGRCALVLPDGTLFGGGVKSRIKEELLKECNLHTIVRLPNSVFKPYASIGTNLLFFEKGSPTKDIWFYEHQVPAGQKAYSMTRPIKLGHLKPCADWWGGAKRKGRIENEVAWRVDFKAILAEARSKAKPHWEKSEQAGEAATAFKNQAISLRIEIKNNDKELASESKASAREKLLAKKQKLEAKLETATTRQAQAEDEQRAAKRTGDGIYDAAFNLDFKNPHSVAADHGEPEEVLAELLAAEKEVNALRDQLKAILAEALAR
jgi:type I restriction enzyme M protein